jgi:S-adenosylmethionine:tRNA ribosyltransferase-isomerase
MPEHPRTLRISDYTYHLPEERIARYPLPQRDRSKLLVWRDGQISEDIYANIAAHLPEGGLLVFNDTRVVQARLRFLTGEGHPVEVFCLGPAARYPDLSVAMAQTGSVEWECLIGNNRKWNGGPLVLESGEVALAAERLEALGGSFRVRLSWQPEHLPFAAVLDAAGVTPLPPYIHRDAEAADKERYQTIFACYDGSVAAPTAGLHFTPAVMESLKEQGMETAFVTLHVSAGTFKPVQSEVLEGHAMHEEWVQVDKALVERLCHTPRQQVVAVGTTTLRTLESLYWMGCKVLAGNADGIEDLTIGQWAPYDFTGPHPPCEEALGALARWMDANGGRLTTRTGLMIAPGYRLKVAGALVTNFHQPGSTLLLLVAALAGPGWRQIYDYALANRFRFLSYGDGCLIWPEGK